MHRRGRVRGLDRLLDRRYPAHALRRYAGSGAHSSGLRPRSRVASTRPVVVTRTLQVLVVAVTAVAVFAVGGAQAAGGAPDPSLGVGGKAVTTLAAGSGGHAFAVALQKEGKVVAAGVSGSDFALVRYSAGGRLDASFGSDGKVRTTSAEMTSPLRLRSRRTGRSSPPATATPRVASATSRSSGTRVTGFWMRVSARTERC